MRITDNHIDILRLFTKRRYIRRTFVHALLGRDLNNEVLRKRIYALSRHGYLNEPEQQQNSGNYRYAPNIYELAPKGCDELNIPYVELSAKEFWHQLMIDDISASAELACRAAGLAFLTRREILLGKPFLLTLADGYLRPDDLFSIGGTHFAVEADRGTESNETRWREKIEQYSEAFAARAYQHQWGIQSLIVLNLFSKPTKAENIRRMIEDKLRKSSRSLWFKGENTLGRHDKTPNPFFFKLDDFWYRAGHEPSTILAALDAKEVKGNGYAENTRAAGQAG
jgi:Replication-relaxation